MDRFFISPDQWESATLTGDEAKHCARVMRKRAGDVIEIFDGAGRSSQAEIIFVAKERVELKMGEPKTNQPLKPEVTLAVGIPKGKTMELIIQKAVELGVARIIPLTSSQGNVKISTGDAEKKRQKWQRVSLEASKQCGQNFLPQVASPSSVNSWLEQENDSLKIVAALRDESKNLKEILSPSRVEKITFLVGPEGDFSSEEYEAAFQKGYQPVSLGDLVLRVETAALFLMSAVRYEQH